MLTLGYHVQYMPQLIELPSNADIFAVQYFGSGEPIRWRIYLKHIRPGKRCNCRMTLAFGDGPLPSAPLMLKVPRFWLPPGWEESVARAELNTQQRIHFHKIIGKFRV